MTEYYVTADAFHADYKPTRYASKFSVIDHWHRNVERPSGDRILMLKEELNKILMGRSGGNWFYIPLYYFE